MKQSRSTAKDKHGFKPPPIQIISPDKIKRLRMIGRAFQEYAERFHADARETRHRLDSLEYRFNALIKKLDEVFLANQKPTEFDKFLVGRAKSKRRRKK